MFIFPVNQPTAGLSDNPVNRRPLIAVIRLSGDIETQRIARFGYPVMNRVIELKLAANNRNKESPPQEKTTQPLLFPASLARNSSQTMGEWTVSNPRIRCRNVNVHYGEKQAIQDLNLDIGDQQVIALIGPSGCGKSTFLRCLNRMNDTVVGCRVSGEILLDGQDIYRDGVDVVPLRARVGMVFQKPNPFPKSIFENVAYGPRIHGFATNKAELWEIVKKSLERAGLWEEVKDDLDQAGTSLSGGQQQRLCIARTLAVNPDVILMDEPCSALDPIATTKIEQLLDELREHYTIVIVTHNMQQAARVSQRTAYFHLGRLIEVGETARIFTNPRHKLTNDYISGRFG